MSNDPNDMTLNGPHISIRTVKPGEFKIGEGLPEDFTDPDWEPDFEKFERNIAADKATGQQESWDALVEDWDEANPNWND